MYFKNFFLIPTTVFFILLSENTCASSQATINIVGQITPATCDIQSDRNGAVNLGHLSSASLSVKADRMNLQPRSLALKIHCQNPTLIAVRLTDIAANAGRVDVDAVKNRTLFSLGQLRNGSAIGGYQAHIDLARSQVDGRPIGQLLQSADEGRSWHVAESTLTTRGTDIYSWGSNLQPLQAQSVNIRLILEPFIFNRKSGDDVKLSGITTFDLVYL